jgi:hypothetical protein
MSSRWPAHPSRARDPADFIQKRGNAENRRTAWLSHVSLAVQERLFELMRWLRLRRRLT